jgi:hypothetical protein
MRKHVDELIGFERHAADVRGMHSRALEPVTGMCQVEAACEQLAVHDTASGAIRILIGENRPKGDRLAEKGDYGDKYSGATLPPDPRAGGVRATPGRHRH